MKCLGEGKKWSVTLGQIKLDINSWMSMKWGKAKLEFEVQFDNK